MTIFIDILCAVLGVLIAVLIGMCTTKTERKKEEQIMREIEQAQIPQIDFDIPEWHIFYDDIDDGK